MRDSLTLGSVAHNTRLERTGERPIRHAGAPVAAGRSSGSALAAVDSAAKAKI